MLIRALEPRWGIEEMSRRRRREGARELCSGPGKLTEALGIGLEMNRAPLAEPPFELRGRDDGWRDVAVATGPRIGITPRRRASLALLRGRQRVPVAAAALSGEPP